MYETTHYNDLCPLVILACYSDMPWLRKEVDI